MADEYLELAKDLAMLWKDGRLEMAMGKTLIKCEECQQWSNIGYIEKQPSGDWVCDKCNDEMANRRLMEEYNDYDRDADEKEQTWLDECAGKQESFYD